VLSDEPVPPTYLPKVASEFAFALSSKTSYAALTFSAFPTHAFKHDAYKALPYENERLHGLEILVILFISLKLAEASSSD